MSKTGGILSVVVVAAIVVGWFASTIAQPAPQPEAEPPVDYLIVCADGLEEVAREWAAYRESQGRRTRVRTVDSAMGDRSESYPATLEEIKKAIGDEAGLVAAEEGKEGSPPREGFQVLLLGDCPHEGTKESAYDPKQEIPWQMTEELDGDLNPKTAQTIPTDNYYADLIEGDEGRPEIAVGRIPARTSAQARAALAKVKAYEAAEIGQWSRRLTFFAGEGRFGPMVDSLIEQLFTRFVDENLDQAFEVRMTYANLSSPYAWPPHEFSDKVVKEANDGSLMLVYLGHGSHDRLDDMRVPYSKERFPILAGSDIESFAIADAKLPVMLIVACATGYMDHPRGSLAERVCFSERAPIAVVASSRDSHPYSNMLVQKGLISEITASRRETLGEAFRLMKLDILDGNDKARLELDQMAAMLVPK
ncbi:MAG: C25 family cysteine peptidase, partial [Nitrospira sp.]|nr:C25 family cysteine peptidase [Nitrospira sp.]